MAAGSSSTKAAAKPRSPVERLVVWGFIGILLVLVGVEFTFRSSHLGAFEKCQEKIKATEVGDNSFKHKDVVAIVGSKTPKVEDLKGKNISNGAKSVEIYTWPTLNPMSKRELYVYYGHGDDPDVIGVGVIEEETTDKKFPPPTEAELEAAKKNNTPLTVPGGMGPPGGMMPPGAGKPPEGDKTEGEKPADEEKKPDEAAGDEKPADEAAPTDKPVE